MSDKLSSKDLPKMWASPDNSRLMPKQLSIRLPIHVAAKIFALEAIFPGKTRTQIIGDLLSCALEDIEDGLPSEDGREFITDEGETVYEDIGPKARYRQIYEKKLAELESEIAKSD